MSLTILAKKTLAPPLEFIRRLNSLVSKREDSMYMILMYHRVIKKSVAQPLVQDGMYVDPVSFRFHIEFLRDHFHVAPLEEVTDFEKARSGSGNGKTLCFITFDDGWRDFYENAYPILNAYQAYATVFLPSDLIGSGNLFWTDRVAMLLGKREQYKYGNFQEGSSSDEYVEIIKALSGPIQVQIENALAILKRLPSERIESIIESLANEWGVEHLPRERSFLTWEEVREMHRSGIVSFGSHTKSHRILTTASEDQIREELVLSRGRLLSEGVASDSFIPFSYPNGDFTQDIERIVKESGYSVAVTTQKGWNRFPDKTGDLFRLKRIGIHQDIASTRSMFACRIYGIY